MLKNKTTFILVMSILSFFSFACGETAKTSGWQKAKILAEKLDHPAAITTDESSIYYVTGGTIASLDEGTSGVWKMPLSGEGQPVQLFKGHYLDKEHVVLPEFFVLETDDKYVYWASAGIWRTPKTGGESVRIADGMPTEWTIDETKIYWHNFGGENAPPKPIYVADKNGGDAKAFTEPVITTGIVGDKDFVYWAQSDGIFKQAKNADEKSRVYAPPEKQRMSGLIADRDNFYFTQGDGGNALFKISKTGGEPVKIAPSINHVSKFYVDETHVYFIIDGDTFGSSLNRVPKNGGDVVKIDSGYSSSYTVGKDNIFVTDITKIYSLAK